MKIIQMLRKILIPTIILINALPSYCQVIRDLSINHAVVNARKESHALLDKSSSLDTIYFVDEFFEDFSSYHYEVFPRSDVWADQSAYINSTYADTMISLGVATLDAYDKEGFPYYSSLRKVSEADTLTSQPFNMDGNLADSLLFSFFYQGGGKVSQPDSIDSLFVDFAIFDSIRIDTNETDPLDIDTFYVDKWTQVYSIGGGKQMHRFEQVILPVDSSFVKNGFRFRFRNTVSLSMSNITGQDLGKFSNADQWHIDYIQIKPATGINREELAKINDMCMIKPLMPSLTEYTSVPYQHYGYAREIKRGTMPISYKTNFPEGVNIVSLIREYYSYDLLRDHLKLNFLEYRENIEPNAFFKNEENFNPFYSYIEGDTIGKLELVSVIKAQAIDQKLINDTAKRIEVYHDHYAYDDGTAELGLGIAGEQQSLNRIAVRFKIYKPSNDPDSLRAILIYFNKSIDDFTSNSEFRISIRKNDSHNPVPELRNFPASDTLYTSRGYFPDYETKLNEFTRIELDRPIALTDTFFIVIEQLDSYLNIGYDINNNNLKNMYFYTGQTWENYTHDTLTSLPKGSLMIRPSFGTFTSNPNSFRKNEIAINYKLFPNPTRDVLYFESEDYQFTHCNVRIYNIMGVMLLNSVSENNAINVSSLNKGIYLIQITSIDNKKSITSKFIKE